jgi:hypothetical protein
MTRRPKAALRPIHRRPESAGVAIWRWRRIRKDAAFAYEEHGSRCEKQKQIDADTTVIV